jgi:DNA (cytosine-5)-methyltransferase 1
MIKIFEAFAGYGTATFALKQLGIEHKLIGFSEIDKYAIQCFQQNHGGTNYGDITKIDWSQVPDFDLLTGGFPCQSFSVAGKGLGHLDERGALANYLTKALIEKQPKYFMFENVKGFMSKKHQEFKETLFNDWKNAGYEVSYQVLNTKEHGIPQNRERVFIIGIRKDIKQFGDFVFPEKEELKLKLKDLLEEQVEEKYFLSEQAVSRIMNSKFSQSFKNDNTKYIGTMTAGYYKIPSDGNYIDVGDVLDVNQIRREGKPRIYHEHCKTLNTAQGGGHTPLYVVGCAKTLKGLGGGLGAKTGLYLIDPKTHRQYDEVTPCLRGGIGSGNKFQVAFNEPTIIDLYNKKERIDYSITLTEPHHNNLRLGVGTKVRRLTPKECFRLQGFLQDEVNLDGLSDTQKYKLAGNGQSVNVVKLIFKELLEKFEYQERLGDLK